MHWEKFDWPEIFKFNNSHSLGYVDFSLDYEQQSVYKTVVTASLSVFETSFRRHHVPIIFPCILLSIELGSPSVTSTKEGLINHGTTVTMTCTATGNAHPALSWTDSNRNTLVEGGVLTLSNVNVFTSGIYTCQAKRDNTVKFSNPIHLNVTCKLEELRKFTKKVFLITRADGGIKQQIK